jgi:hypothetical protein
MADPDDVVVRVSVDTSGLTEPLRRVEAFYADGIGPSELRPRRPDANAQPTEDLEGFEDDEPTDDDNLDVDNEYIDYLSDKYLYGTPAED